MAGDYENEKAPLVKSGGGGGREVAMLSHMKQTGRSVEELLVAVKDTVVDVADAFRSGGKQSLAQRTQDVIHAQTPRLRNALRHVVADVLLWMHQGGLWRTLLVSAVSFSFCSLLSLRGSGALGFFPGMGLFYSTGLPNSTRLHKITLKAMLQY